MYTSSANEAFDTIVIGAGQAGLAVGYYLKAGRREFAVLSADARVGDTWRKRWDSLRLFTPARYSSLPGLPFPGAPYSLPLKDEVADYLETYAERFALPVRLNTNVRTLSREGDQFIVRTGDRVFTARNVIVATGAFQKPSVPPFAGELAENVRQLHSSEYKGPDQLPQGPTLVVGAGNSGAQIALELAASREVWLSGPDVGRLPRRVFGRDVYTWIWPTILEAPVDGWAGRFLKAKRFASSDPLIGVDVRSAPSTLRRVGRTVSARFGRPVLEGGEVLEVESIIWCTGFTPDYGWIHLDVFGEDGYPRHTRGVVDEAPGLYFLGIRFLSRQKSSLIGGVGADAAYVAAHLRNRLADAGRHTYPAATRASLQTV